ncbi:hypothetical protein MRBLMR1_005897 [Neorhizobium sp. LMR1-1-1.1]
MDATLSRLFGIDPASGAGGLPFLVFVDMLHADDRATVSQSIGEAVRVGGAGRQSFRIRSPNGLRRVAVLGQAFSNAGEKTSQYTGVIFEAGVPSEEQRTGLVDHCIAAYRLARELNAELPVYFISMALIEMGFEEAQLEGGEPH